MSEERFDYGKAMAELENIAVKLEDPQTSLEDIGGLVNRSKTLLKECREYLRSVRESIEKEAES